MIWILYLTVILRVSEVAWGQEKPLESPLAPDAKKELPQAILTPWRLIGIDSERAFRAKKDLETLHSALSSTLLKNPRDFNTTLDAQTALSLNTRRAAAKIKVGELTESRGNIHPLVIEPSWANLRGRSLFVITVSHAKRNQLLGSSHISFEASKNPENRNVWPTSQEITTLALEALELALKHPMAQIDATASDAFHLSVSIGRESPRQDFGDHHGLALLLEEAFASQFTTVRALGSDHLILIHDLLKIPLRLQRPTRSVVMRWFHDPEIVPIKSQKSAQSANKNKTPTTISANFPATIRYSATFAETVHGESIAPKIDGVWSLQVQGKKILFKIDQPFEDFLSREQSSLKIADMPQAVKIDRAWVYVDRGRSWGLNIGDRLLASQTTDKSEDVKGHVVGYFGPELKLTSQRGFPIKEGAIIFIRKNQMKVKKGMIFQFDPQTFPTAWPPVSR